MERNTQIRNVGGKQRQRDAPLHLPEARSIHLGRFIQFIGNGLHAGKHQNHGKTDVFPADQQQQRPNSDFRVGQPIGTIDAEVGQNLIDGAFLLQQQAPSGADDDLGNDIRHEDEGADETTPLELLVQQQCEQDGERAWMTNEPITTSKVCRIAAWNAGSLSAVM